MASDLIAHRPTARRGADEAHRHAVGAGVAWFVAAYATLSLATIAVGLVLTHGPLSVESWDMDASVWLFNHRTAFLNSVSNSGTFVANTLGIVVVAIVVTACTVVRRCGRLIALVPVGLVPELLVFLQAKYTV